MLSLDDLGWNAFFDRQMTDDERVAWTPARVVWSGRERYRLSTGDTEWDGRLSGRLRHDANSRSDLPVIGDWVLAALRPNEMSATIYRRLSRQSCFSRAGAGRSTAEQVVAANVGTVLLVTSFNRDFNPRRIERYLALAWQSGAVPIVVLNKADLCADHDRWLAEMAPVCGGVRILVTSALRGDGMLELRQTVRTSGTTALLGSSGVGKSTLVNALVGGSHQDVLPIRDDDRGRHGTTARRLFCLAGGGILIDTPGMRELQLWDADTGLEHAFEDIQSLVEHCRFRDCSHTGEPGCAVTSAVERGELAPERLDSYSRLQREEKFLRSRYDERARTDRSREARVIAKSVRLQYKLRRH